MKIQCDCGKAMENGGKQIEMPEVRTDNRSDFKVFNLFVSNYCGDQHLHRKLEDNECYEI